MVKLENRFDPDTDVSNLLNWQLEDRVQERRDRAYDIGYLTDEELEVLWIISAYRMVDRRMNIALLNTE